MSDTTPPPQTAGGPATPTPGAALPPYPPPVHYPPQPWQPPLPPAPAAQPKGGFGRGFGIGAGAGIGFAATVAVGMLASSLVFGLLAGAGAAAVPSTSEVVWGSPAAANTIRAFSVTGPILAAASDGSTLAGGTYGYELAAAIDDVGTEDAAGLLLVMNTPGGTINGSKAIADAVTRYQERTGKKVVALVEGLSASGGMYAMAGADEIIADHGSLIGSIGVIYGPISRYKDVTAITGSILEGGVVTTGGITQEYLTMGRGKDFGNPFRDITDEEREVFTGAIQNMYDDFVNWVATARGLEPSFITGTLGAHVFDTETAVEHGLVDTQLGIMEAYAHAAQVMGVDPDNTKIVTDAPPSLLDQLLGAQARTPGHAVPEQVAAGHRASAAICSSTPAVLVFHGELGAVCAASR